MTEMPAVIIDGAVPRSDSERCEVVLDYLHSLIYDGPNDPDPAHVQRYETLERDVEEPRIVYHGYFAEVEQPITDMINELLPDGFVCTVGEQQPGDVVVREVGNPEEEAAAM